MDQRLFDRSVNMRDSAIIKGLRSESPLSKVTATDAARQHQLIIRVAPNQSHQIDPHKEDFQLQSLTQP